MDFRHLFARLFGEVPPAPPPRPTFELLPPAPPWRPEVGEAVWVMETDAPRGREAYDGPAVVTARDLAGFVFRVQPDLPGQQLYSFRVRRCDLWQPAIAEDVLEILHRLEADAG